MTDSVNNNKDKLKKFFTLKNSLKREIFSFIRFPDLMTNLQYTSKDFHKIISKLDLVKFVKENLDKLLENLEWEYSDPLGFQKFNSGYFKDYLENDQNLDPTLYLFARDVNEKLSYEVYDQDSPENQKYNFLCFTKKIKSLSFVKNQESENTYSDYEIFVILENILKHNKNIRILSFDGNFPGYKPLLFKVLDLFLNRNFKNRIISLKIDCQSISCNNESLEDLRDFLIENEYIKYLELTGVCYVKPNIYLDLVYDENYEESENRNDEDCNGENGHNESDSINSEKCNDNKSEQNDDKCETQYENNKSFTSIKVETNGSEHKVDEVNQNSDVNIEKNICNLDNCDDKTLQENELEDTNDAYIAKDISEHISSENSNSFDEGQINKEVKRRKLVEEALKNQTLPAYDFLTDALINNKTITHLSFSHSQLGMFNHNILLLKQIMQKNNTITHLSLRDLDFPFKYSQNKIKLLKEAIIANKNLKGLLLNTSFKMNFNPEHFLKMVNDIIINNPTIDELSLFQFNFYYYKNSIYILKDGLKVRNNLIVLDLSSIIDSQYLHEYEEFSYIIKVLKEIIDNQRQLKKFYFRYNGLGDNKFDDYLVDFLDILIDNKIIKELYLGTNFFYEDTGKMNLLIEFLQKNQSLEMLEIDNGKNLQEVFDQKKEKIKCIIIEENPEDYNLSSFEIEFNKYNI